MSFTGARPPAPSASSGRASGGMYRWIFFPDELVVGTSALVDHQWCVTLTMTGGASVSGMLWLCSSICSRERARARGREVQQCGIRSAQRASKTWSRSSLNSPARSLALCPLSPLYHHRAVVDRLCCPPPLIDGPLLGRGPCFHVLVLSVDVLANPSPQSAHGSCAPRQGPSDAYAWVARRFIGPACFCCFTDGR